MGTKKRFEVRQRQRAKRKRTRKKMAATGKNPDEVFYSGFYLGPRKSVE